MNTSPESNASQTVAQIALPPEEANFEVLMATLERIVTTLEKGDISLEDSMALFEQGVVLQRRCQNLLGKAEKRVHILMEKNGEIVAEDFESTAK
jgi:exodeoxyribonuclease VII small subunit